MSGFVNLMGVTVQFETGHHLCWVRDRSVRTTRHLEAGHYLFGICGPLIDFGKVQSMSSGRPLVCGGASRKCLGWNSNWVGQVIPQRITEARQIVLVRLMEGTYLAPAWAGWVGGGLDKGKMTHAITSSLE